MKRSNRTNFENHPEPSLSINAGRFLRAGLRARRNLASTMYRGDRSFDAGHESIPGRLCVAQHRQKHHFFAALMPALAFLALSPCRASYLDPESFTSVGALDISNSDQYSFNTNNDTLIDTTTSTTLFTGVTFDGIAVFDFSGVDLSGGNFSVSGSDPLALLSQTNLTITDTASFSANNGGGGGGSGGAGGPGGPFSQGGNGGGPGGGRGSITGDGGGAGHNAGAAGGGALETRAATHGGGLTLFFGGTGSSPP